ncbi:MAG: hypothetical protein LIP01_14930 [Tannerellaceae bacterium]|nr:hypothetical protein [Tannerellaceae bacterium]
MKYITYIVCVTIIIFIGIYMTLTYSFTGKVEKAVNEQLTIYPASTLKDIYKNFFQDKYGPGHLIHDPVAAGNYLQRELAEMTVSSGKLIEPTGWEGNFYRVNLSLIKDSIIPYDLFFDVFVRSVNSITPIPVEEWAKEWFRIEKIIRNMNLALPEYESDKTLIEKNLRAGEYVGHHSDLFEATYSPHYRIVSRELFEKELRPLLKEYLP